MCSANSTSTNTARTASKPSFTGTVPASGQQILTETVGGTVTYVLTCTAPGTATVSVSTSVFWSWPSETATSPASPESITAREGDAVTWSLEPPDEEGGDDSLAA